LSINLNNGIPEADLPVKNPSGAALVRYVENGKSYSAAMPDVVAASELVQDAIDGIVSDAESQLDEIVSNAQTEIGAIISGLGYLPPVEFGSGILVDSGRVTVEYNGDVYAPVLSEVPFTTTGIFDPDQWRVIQGVTASDLASVDEGKGAAMVRYDADETVAQRLDALGNLRADLASPSNGGTLVGFQQAGTSAVARTALNKMRDVIHARDFGVVADGVTDDRAALQAAINRAMTLGAELRLPAGVMRVSSPGLVLDSSTATANGVPRAWITGETELTTILRADAGDYRVLTVLGGVAATSGVNSLQCLKNFTVERVDMLGVCIHIERCSLFRMENVATRNGQIGLRMFDVLSSVFDQCHFSFARYGILSGRQAFSDPNSLTFIGCTIGGNSEVGANFTGGSNVNFFGGSFEGNGIGGTDPSRHHLAIINAGNEGGAGVNVFGTYFENGSGTADVLISNNQDAATYNIIGATFNRTSNVNIMTNCIRIDSSVPSALNVHGCGFKSFNTYTPSAGRPYIAIASASQPVKLTESGNIFASTLEKTMPPGPHHTSALMPTAFVRYNGADGAISASANVASVTRIGTGRCQVNFGRAMAKGTNVYVATIAGGAGVAFVSGETASSVTIDTVTLAGAGVDMQVSLAVFDGGDIAV
jgi:hypothetical protein